jgi:hypothetical protein
LGRVPAFGCRRQGELREGTEHGVVALPPEHVLKPTAHLPPPLPETQVRDKGGVPGVSP